MRSPFAVVAALAVLLVVTGCGQPVALQPAVPTPVGSPYGFTQTDWRAIATAKSDTRRVYVVMGYAFRSEHYDTEALKTNVRAMFERAVAAYNFNDIARDLISADIAVFDTSDQRPVCEWDGVVESPMADTSGRLSPPFKPARPF